MKKLTNTPWTYLVLGVLVFVYLTIRASIVPLIHDEAVTYYTYMDTANFIPGYAYWDANNHLLFSALGALFCALFNYSLLVVRLASLLFFPVYAYYTYQVARKQFEGSIRLLFFIVMLTTPFVIEFYSLARGYGIGLACFMGLINYTLKGMENHSFQTFLRITIFGMLTLLGNLSFFVGVLAVVGWYFIHWIVISAPKWTQIAKRLAIFVGSLAPLVYYMFELKERNLLYYGGSEFVSFFLKPFAVVYLQNKAIWPVVLVPFALAVVLLAIAVKKGFSTVLGKSMFFPLTLVSGLVGIVALQLILHVNYPEDRTALYYFPLMVGTLFSVTHLVSQRLRLWVVLPLLWFPINGIVTANSTHSRLWDYEHVPKRFYSHVHFEDDGYPATLSARGLRKHIWNSAQYGAEQASFVSETDVPSTIADYILIDSTRVKKVDMNRYALLDYDSISYQSLLVRKKMLQWNFSVDTVMTDVETNYEYYNLFDFQVNPFDTAALKLKVAFTPNGTNQQYPLSLICTAFDTAGATLYYEKLNINERTEKWEENEYKFMQYLPHLPRHTGRVVFYFYNPTQQPVRFKSLKASIFTLSGDDF